MLPGLDAAAGVAALSAGLGSPYGVSGAAWLPAAGTAHVPALPNGQAAAMIRIEEFAESVRYRIGRLRDQFGLADAVVLEGDASRDVWRAIRDVAPLGVLPEHAVWRVSVRPSAGPAVLAAAQAAGLSGFLDWGGGLVWLSGAPDAAAHRTVETAARASGGVWTLMRAPDALRLSVDVVPPEPKPLARITQEVKSALDPAGIFNPGRLYAGL